MYLKHTRWFKFNRRIGYCGIFLFWLPAQSKYSHRKVDINKRLLKMWHESDFELDSTFNAHKRNISFFANLRKQAQLYFPAVLMPTYPLGQLMTAKPWNVFAHCSKLNYFWVDQKITQIQISKNLREIKVESDIWSW